MFCRVIVPESRAQQDARPRWSRRKDARPAEIIEAALDLFVERGFAATRADEVAARAGISKGTLYLYYANKEELFKAVVRETIVPTISEATDTVRDWEGSTPDLLTKIMFRWWNEIGATKVAGITKLVMAESGNFPEIAQFYFDEVIAPAHAMFAAMIERGMQRQEFRQTDVAMTTQFLMSPMLMLIMWKQSIGPCARQPLPDPIKYIQHVIDTALHGLLAP